MTRGEDDVLVLGGGLTGLSAADALTRAGLQVTVVERDGAAGGLARTVAHGPFRFDLGGHRFLTRDPRIQALVLELVGAECQSVERRSQIHLRGRVIDYPLNPANALSGLGALTALRIVGDRLRAGLMGRLRPRPLVSLEDWVVRHFGRTLFDLYFREYSEKVWGLPCDRISMDWVARRIQGLSLGAAVANAFWRRAGRGIPTLADRFLYPAHGIGRIAERLQERIEQRGRGRVLVDHQIHGIAHHGSRVQAVRVRRGARAFTLEARSFVSTIPINALVRMLDPRPPLKVLRAAAGLRFRDLVLVAVMLDRPRATDQSWLYFPDRTVSFGRIHEPTNWSQQMAPPGKTLLVAEHFCFQGGDTWMASDQELAERTIADLVKRGIVFPGEVEGTTVLRIPQAYPLFEVGYPERLRTVLGYLGGLENLFPAGRGGAFTYCNMDDALAAGLGAAARVLDSEAWETGAEEPAALPERRFA